MFTKREGEGLVGTLYNFMTILTLPFIYELYKLSIKCFRSLTKRRVHVSEVSTSLKIILKL